MKRRIMIDLIKISWKYRQYILFAAKAELKAQVADSYLNWLWWVLDPLLFMGIYSFVSIVVFQRKEPYFPVFCFIGLSIWNFFGKSMNQCVRLIRARREIISKVYVPKYVLIFVILAENAFKLGISMILVFLLMACYTIPVSISILFLIPLFVLLTLVTFAFCELVMHYGVYLEDLSNLQDAGMRFLFYLSGVFYNLRERVPIYGALLISVNPIAGIIECAREILIYQRVTLKKGLVIWIFLAIIISCIGSRKIRNHEDEYVKVI